MATLKWSPKDPADTADYWFDWGSDLLAAADRFLPDELTIADALVTIPAEEDQPDPPETSPYDYLTKVAWSFTTKAVRVRLSGGIDATTYNIDCLITLSDGQIFELTKKLPVKERIK